MSSDQHQAGDADTPLLESKNENVLELSSPYKTAMAMALFDNSPDAIIVVDESGYIIDANIRTTLLFGHTYDQLLNQPLDILIPERMRSEHIKHLKRFLDHPQARKMSSGLPLMALRADGLEFPVDVMLSPMRIENQLLVTAVIRDLTERRRYEEVLKEMNTQLEERVASRTVELEKMNQQLTQKNEEVEAFVYIVSHDLRAPLVNLQGFSQELKRSCEDIERILSPIDFDAEIKREIEFILQSDVPGALRYLAASAAKFERLIDALLQLSRYGKQDYVLIDGLDVNQVVRTTLDSLKQWIDERRAVVSVGDLPPVVGDMTAIGQVFSNLIGNALKYLKPGRQGQIEIDGVLENERVHYWVRDNGAGIPAGVRHRLFRVFQRFHPDLAQGEGMGLAIVKRIVERHKGTIWVESVEDQGTTFHIVLPACSVSPRE